MQAKQFFQTVVRDRSAMLDRLLSLLETHDIRFCVIGGQAVNAYAEPVVSLDLDIVVALDRLEMLEALLKKEFSVEQFPHSMNVSAYGSDLRVQIQTDPRYAPFPTRAVKHEVLGMLLPVASLTDLMQGKIWAALDASRRSSKRQKDLADIARLLEAYPELRRGVPEEIMTRLF